MLTISQSQLVTTKAACHATETFWPFYEYDDMRRLSWIELAGYIRKAVVERRFRTADSITILRRIVVVIGMIIIIILRIVRCDDVYYYYYGFIRWWWITFTQWLAP